MEYVALTARICLCLIFFKAGFSHIFGFAETAAMISDQGLPVAT